MKKGMWRWTRSGAVLALGALVVWMGVPGGAQAQYPPPTGSATLLASDVTPTVGGSVALNVQIVDTEGAPVEGASCLFTIAEQPGTNAHVLAGPVITDAAGIAETTLTVGSIQGLIGVQAQCGELTALTSVVAGAAIGAAPAPPAPIGAVPAPAGAVPAVGLPATGDGSMASSDGGATPWLVALTVGVALALAVGGVRRARSRHSS